VTGATGLDFPCDEHVFHQRDEFLEQFHRDDHRLGLAT
jgi:hypothetical protein